MSNLGEVLSCSLLTVLEELCKKFKGRLDFHQARWTWVSVNITATTKHGGFQQRLPLGEAVA